jgi:hypothetical protein
LKSYCNTLPTVRWYPVKTTPPEEEPTIQKKRKTDGIATPIEPLFVYEEPPKSLGKSTCIGNYIVLYMDNIIYIKNIQQFNDGTTWKRLLSVDFSMVQQVHAATLNTLDNTRAIMFGGLKQYDFNNRIQGTSQVAILHVEENESDIAATSTSVPNVWWEVIDRCHVFDNPSMVCSDTNSTWSSIAARGFHASTLFFNRFLFVVGGTQYDEESLLNPILLDCQTWTWYVDGITTSCTWFKNSTGNKCKLFPSKRHGCSLIADVEYRNRLLLFGGGIGYDFMAARCTSGVWELIMDGCNSSDGVLKSMPWKWNLLHKDQTVRDCDDSDDDEDNDHADVIYDDIEEEEGNNGSHDEAQDQIDPNNILSCSEQLILGQCHCGYRVGRDTVLLVFGRVGGIMTNDVLCYNLKENSFFRTRVHDSFHPYSRYDCQSAYIESKGIIVFYGGISDSSREGMFVTDTILLDLAPALNVQQQGPNGRLWLPLDTDAKSHTPTGVRLSRVRSWM